MRGKFITFEGPDGSGKTTQVRLIAEYLGGAGYHVLTTREPGGTVISEKIRDILLDPANDTLADRSEVFLYAAARAQHVEQLIKPALADGKVVICDRFIDSTLAYQGFGRGIDLDFLQTVNEMAAGGLLPDITIILDIDSHIGLERIRCNRRKDRLEGEKLEFHHRVRQGYLKIAQKYPQRIRVVSAEEGIEEVFKAVKEYIQDLF
ncbi:MAG: dTMP kinase [Bacillota bacterium]|jgi:dTMP kinase